MVKNSIRKLLIYYLLLIPISIFAQVQPEHQKKMFTNEQGRVYINKALPLYFKLSTSPNPNSEKHLLESQSSPQFTNPMYFDKEGLNYIYTPWAVDTTTRKVITPKQYVKFEIYVDSKPPVTKIKNNLTAYDKGDTLFFGPDLKITFKSEDKTSGVEKTYYSINNEDFKEYSSELSFEQEKSYEIKYYSVDKVGNVEKVRSIKFTIDSSKPLTNLKIHGAYYENIISGGASIALKSQDAFSGVSTTYYLLDNNELQVYHKPISASTLREGKHTLSYYTEDEVQNKENENTYVFFVDKTPPIIIDEIIGNSFVANGKQYTSGRTKLQLSAIDNRAGVKSIYYSMNNEDFQLYTEPFYLPNEKGNLQIKFYAVDKVENKTNSNSNNNNNNQFFQSYTDLNGPVLKYEYKGESFFFNDTMFISPTSQIFLEASDAESGVQKITYSIDQQLETDFSPDNGISVNGDGIHSMNFFGYDNVNNTSEKSFSFKVDGTGPEIISQFSLNPISQKIIEGISYPVYPKHAILYLSALDNMVGVKSIFYSINNSSEKLYTFYIHNLSSGVYNIKVRAIDYLKNETITEIRFFIQNS